MWPVLKWWPTIPHCKILEPPPVYVELLLYKTWCVSFSVLAVSCCILLVAAEASDIMLHEFMCMNNYVWIKLIKLYTTDTYVYTIYLVVVYWDCSADDCAILLTFLTFFVYFINDEHQRMHSLVQWRMATEIISNWGPGELNAVLNFRLNFRSRNGGLVRFWVKTWKPEWVFLSSPSVSSPLE